MRALQLLAILLLACVLLAGTVSASERRPSGSSGSRRPSSSGGGRSGGGRRPSTSDDSDGSDAASGSGSDSGYDSSGGDGGGDDGSGSGDEDGSGSVDDGDGSNSGEGDDDDDGGAPPGPAAATNWAGQAPVLKTLQDVNLLPRTLEDRGVALNNGRDPFGLDDANIIGRGGSGVVYRANLNKFPGNTFIVKTATKLLDSEAANTALFQGGPFILKLWGFIRAVPALGGTPLRTGGGLVIAPCTGGDFESWGATGPSDAEIVRQFSRAVVALAFVHQKGYVHLDVKPENFMICAGNWPRLIDYGSVTTKADLLQMYNVAKRVVGVTPRYVSPELQLKAWAATAKTAAQNAAFPTTPITYAIPGMGPDVYALGISLWQLYADRASAKGPTKLPEVTLPFYNTAPALPKALRLALSDARKNALWDLIDTLTQLPADRRPKDASELLHTYFSSDYVLNSGVYDADIPAWVANTKEAKARAILEIVNEEGIFAAASDERLKTSDRTDRFVGNLEVYGQGGAQTSSVTGFSCGGTVRVAIGMTPYIRARCADGTLTNANGRMFLKVFDKQLDKLGKSRAGPIAGRPTSVAFIDNLCDLPLLPGQADTTVVTLSRKVLKRGTWFLYGKLKTFTGAKPVVGKDNNVGTELGYTSEIKIQVTTCAR
ncbi:kinase-like domain-containing protein [Hyaloraphidium curvatum]|nr:kinase-like domain-containing protein [Hyaloraphidium curvatum]